MHPFVCSLTSFYSSDSCLHVSQGHIYMLTISMYSASKLSVVSHFRVNLLIHAEPDEIQGLFRSTSRLLLVFVVRHVSNPIPFPASRERTRDHVERRDCNVPEIKRNLLCKVLLCTVFIGHLRLGWSSRGRGSRLGL